MTRNSDAGTPCPAALWARGGPKPTCISCQQAELLKGRQTLGDWPGSDAGSCPAGAVASATSSAGTSSAGLNTSNDTLSHCMPEMHACN